MSSVSFSEEKNTTHAARRSSETLEPEAEGLVGRLPDEDAQSFSRRCASAGPLQTPCLRHRARQHSLPQRRAREKEAFALRLSLRLFLRLSFALSIHVSCRLSSFVAPRQPRAASSAALP